MKSMTTTMKSTILITLKGIGNLELLFVLVGCLLWGWASEALFVLVPAIIQHSIAYFYLSESKVINLKGEVQALIYTVLIIVGTLCLLAPVLLALYFLLPNWNPSRTIGSITMGEVALTLIGIIIFLMFILFTIRLEKFVNSYIDKWQESYFNN